MATGRTTKAYKREMRITLQDLSRQLEIVPVDHLRQTAEEKLILPYGLKRSTNMTNKIIRNTYAAVFVIIVLVTLIGELAR